MRLLLATSNPGKVAELERMLTPLGIEVVTPKELGIDPEVEETGITFAENARLKAETLFQRSGLPTLADDSGLCVDALGGAPGVYTARYGGVDADYPTKFALLFGELAGVEATKRTAQFVCSICCVIDQETVLETTGSCPGTIGTQPAGEDGFGYDPIFYLGERSFAQLSPEEKDRVSHRGIALEKMVALLEKQLGHR